MRTRSVHSGWRRAIADSSGDDLFDPDFLSELEGLVAETGAAVSAAAPSAAALAGSQATLARFLAPAAPGGPPLGETEFLALSPAALTDRCNALVESCRESPHREPAQAVESFVVFFQALLPMLSAEPARSVRATFFRLAPTLAQMGWDDPAAASGRRRDSAEALRLLETILLEISSVHLTPAESELVFRSLDQLASLISAGEYALARDVVGAPLLAILHKNRVTRALFRLMEVEVSVQVYLKARLGYVTPQVRVPDDFPALGEFGPIRVFEDEEPDGTRAHYLQVQIPDIPLLSDIVVHLSREEDGVERELRLDRLGSSRFDLPPGLYRVGLLYAPEEPSGG
ncbi:MAG TPA: hypothetical protein VMX54_14890 [Vicinamibacteria bacterium]|nr:hypothetical protein [Vicinamibacteria bacterium]